MAMREAPAGDRIHIGFFGKRNAGKSSLINAVTGQELSVVSDTKGTTTDLVMKTMELLPIGPVMMIDTPGLDDEGDLGTLRKQKAQKALNRCDGAVLVVDATEGLGAFEKNLIEVFKKKEISYIIAYNKNDIAKKTNPDTEDEIFVSAETGEGIFELKELLGKKLSGAKKTRRIAGDLINPGDHVLLVTPIDSSAPKGRMILPQQQTLRDLLDSGAVVSFTKETELKVALEKFRGKPDLVITDSQVFHEVARIVPEDVPLTSFSILMARYKGYLKDALLGVSAIETLEDGDTVLIAEGCTHHRQCNDIGTVKIPNWLKQYTKKEFKIETVSGADFPEDLSPYRVIIHCGGCMLGDREIKFRMKCAKDQNVPVVNYGVLIAKMNGILERSIAHLPEGKEESNG